MSKELIVQPTSRYIGKMDAPLLVIEVEQKKSLFQQFVDGFKAFCDYAATTRYGSGELNDEPLEPHKSKVQRRKK